MWGLGWPGPNDLKGSLLAAPGWLWEGPCHHLFIIPWGMSALANPAQRGCLKEVCARVPPVWRVCASTGSVLVAWELCLSSHAIGCVLWSVRACGVLHSTLPLLFDWCLRESTCVGVCVCGRPGAALRCFPLVSVWLREDTRWLILRLPAHRSVRLCLF